MSIFQKTALAAALALTSFIVPASAFAGYYGALAFSQGSGASGWSKNYETKREAARAALSYCRENSSSGDCKVVYEFTNSCAALAVGSENGYGVAWDVKKGRANKKAIAACEGYDSGCSIVISECSQGD
ncbi:MAG: hypothetical protein JWM58_4422 [Rhizobium sp.]|nr:hypothetical protein [Rhizobium sp.]